MGARVPLLMFSVGKTTSTPLMLAVQIPTVPRTGSGGSSAGWVLGVSPLKGFRISLIFGEFLGWWTMICWEVGFKKTQSQNSLDYCGVVILLVRGHNHFWMFGRDAKHTPSFHHSLPFPQPPSANSIGGFPPTYRKCLQLSRFRRAPGDLWPFNFRLEGEICTPENWRLELPKDGWVCTCFCLWKSLFQVNF